MVKVLVISFVKMEEVWRMFGDNGCDGGGEVLEMEGLLLVVDMYGYGLEFYFEG